MTVTFVTLYITVCTESVPYSDAFLVSWSHAMLIGCVFLLFILLKLTEAYVGGNELAEANSNTRKRRSTKYFVIISTGKRVNNESMGDNFYFSVKTKHRTCVYVHSARKPKLDKICRIENKHACVHALHLRPEWRPTKKKRELCSHPKTVYLVSIFCRLSDTPFNYCADSSPS